MWKHWHFWHFIWLSGWTFFSPMYSLATGNFFSLVYYLQNFCNSIKLFGFYKTLDHFFPFHVLGCMYVWMHVYMCVCVSVYVVMSAHARGSTRLTLGISLDFLFTLYIETESLNQTQSLQIWPVCLRDSHLHHLRLLGGFWGGRI